MKSISCKEAVDFILKKEEGKLSFSQHLKLWYHLWICPLCRYFLDQSKVINKLVARQSKNQEHRLTKDEKEGIIHHVLDRSK